MNQIILTALGDGARLTPCESFTLLFELKIQEAKAWSLAFFAVGTSAAVALVLLIGFALASQPAGSIASAISGLATGGISVWLWRKRVAVHDEAEELLGKSQAYCAEAV